MKNILVSIIIAGLFIICLVLASPSSPVANNISTATGNNTTYVVKFNVSGCDNCTGLLYCIDGGNAYTVNSCSFAADLTVGQHNICVLCNYNKRGYLVFNVIEDPFAQIVNVSVQNDNGSGCNCSGSK